MQLSEQWLRSYANPPLDSDELVARLTMGGVEVESNEPVAPPFSGVVVAQVKSVRKHPDAEKLTVCEVDAGGGKPLQIVCGAPNVAPGVRVPCALEGAQLPGGVRIGTAAMRGVQSQGMLCSARELGLSEDHGGLLLLAPDAPVGKPLREHLALDDRKLTIKVTPNRGDCLSVLGVAREVAAITGTALVQPAFDPVEVSAAARQDRLEVKVLAPDLCGRFSGRVLRGLNAKAPTPEWMKQRLERGGQRPISALVDISNYVMLELGRPTHVFDLDRIKGGLEVRWGKRGERAELLNGQTVEVDPWIGVIADNGGVEALAGVMGGAATAVTLDTVNVYLEAAFWWPGAIQGRARRFNFSTDAAHRFERGTDYSTTVAHLEYLTRLIVQICGTPRTQVGPIDDQVIRLPERAPVRMRAARCQAVIGVALSADEMAQAFERLRFPFTRDQAGDFYVTPPPYRFDLEIEEDLIEEVARLWGFDRIPIRPPVVPAVMAAPPEDRRTVHALRQQMAELGFQETINFSFVDPAGEADFAANERPIRVLNPIASQLAVMRSTLLPSLVGVLKYNLNRKAGRVRIFEIARVFLGNPQCKDGPLEVGGVEQPLRVAALAYGPAFDEQWGARAAPVDFFDLKGDLERLAGRIALQFEAAAHPGLHPGRSARVSIGGRPIGWIGELHPRWLQKYELPGAPIVFEVDAEALRHIGLPQVGAIPRFPAVQRDLAMWFDEAVGYQRVLDTVAALVRSDPHLRPLSEFRLFDVYRPPVADSSKVAGAGANVLLNKGKSLAFRLVLQDTDRTLSDTDADAAVTALVAGLQAQLGGRLR